MQYLIKIKKLGLDWTESILSWLFERQCRWLCEFWGGKISSSCLRWNLKTRVTRISHPKPCFFAAKTKPFLCIWICLWLAADEEQTWNTGSLLFYWFACRFFFFFITSRRWNTILTNNCVKIKFAIITQLGRNQSTAFLCLELISSVPNNFCRVGFSYRPNMQSFAIFFLSVRKLS